MAALSVAAGRVAAAATRAITATRGAAARGTAATRFATSARGATRGATAGRSTASARLAWAVVVVAVVALIVVLLLIHDFPLGPLETLLGNGVRHVVLNGLIHVGPSRQDAGLPQIVDGPAGLPANVVAVNGLPHRAEFHL